MFYLFHTSSYCGNPAVNQTSVLTVFIYACVFQRDECPLLVILGRIILVKMVASHVVNVDGGKLP